MNPLIWILIEAGLNIAKEHGLSGDPIKTGGFLVDAARALDQLSVEETGQPLDWSKIREHTHLAAPGIPAEDPGPDLSMKPDSDPEVIEAAAEPATGPAVTQPPDEDPHPDPEPDPETTDPD